MEKCVDFVVGFFGVVAVVVAFVLVAVVVAVVLAL